MHHGIRFEMYAWELQRRLRRDVTDKRWNDPQYRLLRQVQLDRGKIIGQIFLAVAVLVGISYLFSP